MDNLDYEKKRQILNALKQVSLFKEFNEEQLWDVAKIAEIREAQKSEYLVLEQQYGSTFFVLLSGSVSIQIYLPQNTEMHSIATLGATDLLGELSLVGMEQRAASARVEEKVVALSWNTEDFNAYLDANPQVGYHFMRNLAKVIAERIAHSNKEIAQATFKALYKVS